MPAETLFSICNAAVLPAWLLLIVLPHWKWTTTLIASVIVPFGLGVVYLYLVIVYFASAEGGFGSLADVASLFESPYVLLAGWIHYLAFDLFVGSWEVRDARRSGIHHLLVVPCLVFTFLLGPVGLVMYVGLRGVRLRQVALDEVELAP